MTELAPNQAYLLIEDRLDALGQKYRLQRLARGALLWFGCGLAASVAAAFLAHFLRQGVWTMGLSAVWIAYLAVSAAVWLLRPLLMRPKIVDVARLVESHVPGLHNGLTNSVLLARAADLRSSPFLPSIFEEILHTTQTQPLEQAMKLSDLNPLVRRLSILVLPALLLVGVFHGQVAHGWQQMLAPSHFVPQIGAMQIMDVQPGNITLVAGQPLEISILAAGPQTPEAKLYVDGYAPVSQASLIASPRDGGQLLYGYRIDHVDYSLRYRVDVGSTQSVWYDVHVVRQIRLTELDLTITPPGYTRLAPSTLTLKPEEIGKTPIIVPQGSSVQLAAAIDVPAQKALLQIGDGRDIAMDASPDNQRFSQTLTILADTTVGIGLLEGDQIVAKVPENGLLIRCKNDDPPKITMKWPSQDGVAVAPAKELTIEATITDDYGLSGDRLWMGIGDAPLAIAAEEPPSAFAAGGQTHQFKVPIPIPAAQAVSGQSIHVQVEATDNRDLRDQMKAAGNPNNDDGGPQTARGPNLEIKFAEPQKVAEELKDQVDQLRAILLKMLKSQQDLMDQAAGFKSGDGGAMNKINAGQTDLRNKMTDTASTFPFDPGSMIVKRTLEELAVNPAKDAVDISAAIVAEPVATEQLRLNDRLKAQQQHIISTLESLLAMLRPSDTPTTQPGNGHDAMLAKADAYKKLDEALQQYMKEQQRILNQTASLAKKPVDNFDDADKKLLADLQMAQEKLDAFMQQKIADFSKNAEQDMSNSELIKDLVDIQSEVTMAKDALNQQAAQIAVPLEENALEGAKELTSNIEKWLPNTPDRTQWTQEDPVAKTDTPLPELPKELEDMIGQLMEQEEDLLQQAQDANANWQDSIDKGEGWDATDGPIADMSAKGVTGNMLPNNNEMQGRSGEGRNGQSQGDFVGDSAVGKGGRNTPTRLDPTPFQQGQINDTSKDPVGGATGGGKLSGQGGQGLEGPVPPKVKQEMQRLAQQQAQLRNAAERLNLEYRLDRYDNFKMQQSVDLMRQFESDLQANHYQNALRLRDILVDTMETSKMLVGGELHVQLDTTPAPTGKTQHDISDAMKGSLPPAWSDALKEYYRKLSDQ